MSVKCHYCGKFGHIKRYCHILAEDESKAKLAHKETPMKQKANKAVQSKTMTAVLAKMMP